MTNYTEELGLRATNLPHIDLKFEEEKEAKNVNNDSPNRVPKETPNLVHLGEEWPSPKFGNLKSNSSIVKDEAFDVAQFEDRKMIRDEIVPNILLEKTSCSPRKSLEKTPLHTLPLIDDLPDVITEATSLFQVIKECIYGSKYMGSSGDHDALDCDCSEDFRNGKNYACGENSDCINRATKMECVDGDCNCGNECQNTRFQRRSYADVSVIKTEKKGYGLRANTDLNPNDFVFEYIGEVINEPTFRRRTIQYDEEGIKHFYFMSLTKNEFIDATKKGNLGRFCNHSCNPNCYVDKWVVGDKLRMGVFAERFITAGEELVFNYNVDRYGADPQPCYCGEPNCAGFIGGKTQTERATKLPHTTIEALGIDDDGWDLTVVKKSRKKKTCEDDEEYVNSVQPKNLDEEGVRKVMATLMQCKEKWIAVKLLSRLQNCNDEKVRNRVVQMHGYQILRTTLMTWKDDNNVILQILEILYKFPRLTRNKISDSKIEATIETLVNSEHEDIAFESRRLLELWSKLEVAYRIPRKKFDPNAIPLIERRNTDRPEESAKTVIYDSPVIPSGPRSSAMQQSGILKTKSSIRKIFKTLPSGWFTAKDETGRTYYYNSSGQTTWFRPTYPAIEPPSPPKGPPKSVQTAKALQDIIDSITKKGPNLNTIDPSALSTELTLPKDKKASQEKWRSLPQEKQMKLYENTLFPHIKYIMQKFHHKLPKEDLKKFAREVGKKLVASDFKNKRVEDPTKISLKQEKKVKNYVRAYFERAVAKKGELDRRKKAKEQKNEITPSGEVKSLEVLEVKEEIGVQEIDLSPSSSQEKSLETPSSKRKREYDSQTPLNDDVSDHYKRLKEEPEDVFPSPPPPPPPPKSLDAMPRNCGAGILEVLDDESSSLNLEVENEIIQLRHEQEALILENEEAERLERKNHDISHVDDTLEATSDRLNDDVIETMTKLIKQNDYNMPEKELDLSHDFMPTKREKSS